MPNKMQRPFPSPSLSPEEALATNLQKLTLATGSLPPVSSSSTSPPSSSPPSTAIAIGTTANSHPLLIRKNSNLSGSLPNSPLRRKSSTPALPGSPSTRPISRTPSMVSLSKLDIATPPLPPLTHPDAETIVILNDSSYLHKYTRTSDARELISVVERPERLRAATFGISVALSKFEAKNLSVIKTDRKGSLEDPSVTRVHNPKYPAILVQACDESDKKIAARENELPSGWHTGDLFLCGGSREDFEGCVGALWEGVDRVFGKTDHGDPKDATSSQKISRAFVCIRPPGHHCAEEEPSGFCYLNNVHIAIARAALQYDMTHAVILDFDLHHGDGSQTIAWEVNDRHKGGKKTPKNTPHIAYYSLHDINSYPCEMGDYEKIRDASTCLEDSHNQNIWNVHLEQYKDTQDFWRLYEEKYSVILQKAESFLAKAKASYRPTSKQPGFKAGIFISAGFDASEHEQDTMQRHKVNVLTEFYARFTSDAVKIANTYAEGRVLSVLEGGYSDKAIWTGVFSHLAGLALPKKNNEVSKETTPEIIPDTRVEKVMPRRSSLAQDITGRTLRAFAAEQERSIDRQPENLNTEYDPTWFLGAKLEEIGKAMHVAPSSRASKPRNSSKGDFASPTASSAAKAATRLHRKSSTNLADSAAQSSLNRTPSPPPAPPPLEWPAASAAIWKSLLPEKQLASLREEVSAQALAPPAELTVEKARRQAKRHSAVGIPAVDNPVGAAAPGRTLRSSHKKIADIPERSGSALSSVAESQVSRRASMISIKSSDTADTAITGVSQVSGRRRISPPQKTIAAKAAVSPKPASAAKQQAIAKKPSGTFTPSVGQPAKAPVRSSSLRQPVGSRIGGTNSKGETAAVRSQDLAASPVDPKSVPSIRTTTEPDQAPMEAITSGMQSIKLTYKNRERDQAREEADAQRQLGEKSLKKDILNSKTRGDTSPHGSPKYSVGNGVPDRTLNNDGVSSPERHDGKAAGAEGERGSPPKAAPAKPFVENAKEALRAMAKVKIPEAAGGTSFKDRVAAFSPFQSQPSPWVGAPSRAYKPAGTRTFPSHSPDPVPREPSPKRVDEDVPTKNA
ncbi:hypothetical protein TWF970_010961 [Orbilia oligospora]|uniref:Histone deacetylase domain-containing protein n=1 Tax=Orbilia oligospora TaxID=2813651 RepID=A0A7C8RFB5_ORBOL|nr:hypothetical protein TWF970_010961 [Orbilia oligospora]